MTAREYALANLKECDGMAIKGYTVRKTLELNKPRNSVIVPYKKTTFIDAAIKSKRHVPPSNYNVIPNLLDKNTKSAMCRGMRATIATDAERLAKRIPQPD